MPVVFNRYGMAHVTTTIIGVVGTVALLTAGTFYLSIGFESDTPSIVLVLGVAFVLSGLMNAWVIWASSGSQRGRFSTTNIRSIATFAAIALPSIWLVGAYDHGILSDQAILATLIFAIINGIIWYCVTRNLK